MSHWSPEQADTSGDVDASMLMLPAPAQLDLELLADRYVTYSGMNARLQEWQRQIGDGTLTQKKFLVILGPRGCGKTTLARSLCNDRPILELFSVEQAARDLPQLANVVGTTIILDEMPVRFMVQNKALLTCAGGAMRPIQGDHFYPVIPVTTFGCDVIVTCSTWSVRMQELRENEAAWIYANSLRVVIRT
jgi:hypothetical protein